MSQIQVAEQVVELCRPLGNHTVKLMALPSFPDRNLFGSPSFSRGGGVNAVQISLSSAKSADKTGGGILTRVFFAALRARTQVKFGSCKIKLEWLSKTI